MGAIAMAHDPLNPDNDPFGPPPISTIVHCIHCGEEYDSYKIEWRVEHDADGGVHGFWCCPMPGCDGKGFGFDIFPVDPEYRDENGELMWCSDDDEEFEDGEFTDDEDEFDDGVFAELDDDEDEEDDDWLMDLDGEATARGTLPELDEDIPY
jgi:hypothetical protein